MNNFRWLEDAEQLESLAVCVRSLSALRGTPADYDELVVALGLGSLVVSDARRPVGEWPALARNELLITTAEQVGIRIRDLHPRRAAVGLDASAEYREHFIDSYLPLIERALASAQLALGWRGWPPPRDMQWGVITTSIDGAASGYTLGHSSGPVSLVAPAHQVYIVEEVEQTARIPLEPADALARAAWILQIQESGAWSSDTTLRTGSRAWRDWRKWLGATENERESIWAHRGAAAQVAAARESLGRWLRKIESELNGALRDIAAGWAGLCVEIATKLRGTIPHAGAPLGDVAAWRAATSEVLAELSDLDFRAAELASPHARPIEVRPVYEPNPLEV
jgi:hypothetical protein